MSHFEQPEKPKSESLESPLSGWVGRNKDRKRGPEAEEAKKILAGFFKNLGPASSATYQKELGVLITQHVNDPEGLIDELLGWAEKRHLTEITEALQLTLTFPDAGKES